MSRPKHYSVICAIVRDEEAGLKHWIDYHLAIGFEKFFLFDNNSKISVRDYLSEYIRYELVEVNEITIEDFPQLTAYSSFLKYRGTDAQWVAFIDADEYICLKQTSEIDTFLEGYESYPALGINWKIFGSSGNISRPTLPPTRAYLDCIKEASTIKSIVQPALTKDVIPPHHFKYRNNGFCVNEHSIPISGPRSYHSSEKIQINHYYFKSQQDFEIKMSRGMATPIRNRDNYLLQEFYEQASTTGTKEIDILRFSRKVDLYSKRGPKFIADEINDRTNINVNAVLREAANFVSLNKIDTAFAILSKSLRYKDDPLIHISIAKIHIINQKYDSAMKRLARALTAAGAHSELRACVYKELAALYSNMGMTSQSKHILQELNHKT